MANWLTGLIKAVKTGYNVFKHHLKDEEDINWCVLVHSDRIFGSHSILLGLREALKETSDELLEGQYDPKSIDKSVKEIATCLACIDRLIEDDYCKQQSDELDQRFGKLNMITKPKEPDAILTEVDIKREKQTEQNSELIEQLEQKLWDDQQKAITNDIKKLTTLLRHYRNW